MRIPDATEPGNLPTEPRLLVRREPTETGGQYYRLPEGCERITTDPSHPALRRLDLNRNFPSLWRGI